MEKFQLKRPSTNCAFLAEAEDPRHTDGSQPPPNNCEEQDTIQVRSLPLQQNVLGIASDPTGDAEFHKGIRDSIQFNDTRTLKVLLSSSPTWLVDNFPLQLNSVEDLDLKLCERYQIYGPLSSEMHVFLEEEFGLQHLFVSMSNLSRISTTENELLNTICASLETFKSYADRFLLKNRLTQHRTNLVFFLLVAKKYESWMHIRANQQKYITLTQQTLKKIQLTLTKLLASLHEYTNIFSARDKIRHSRLEILKDNEEPFHCWEIYQSGVAEMEEANIIYKTCRFGRLQRNLLDDLSRAFAEANVAPSTKTPNEAEASQSFSIMKDIYSLNRILHCIDLALSGVSKNESMHCINNLVVERALQVTGEYMKNTDETPNLSKEIQSKLTTAGVQLDLFAEVRNLLSHYTSMEFFSEIKSEDTDVSLVENVKNDLEKVRIVILKTRRNVKIKQVQNLLDVKGSIPDEKNDEVIKLVKHILGDIKRGMSQRNIKETLEKLINILEKHTNLIADVQMAIQEISCFILSDIVQERLHAQNTALLKNFDNSQKYDYEKFGIFDHDWEECKSAITVISSIKQIEQFRNAQIIATHGDDNPYGLTLVDIFVKVIMTNALAEREIKAAIKRMKFGFQTDLNPISLKKNISSAAFFLNALIEVMTRKLGDLLNSYLDAYLHDSSTRDLFKLLKIDETQSKAFYELLAKFRLQTLMMAKPPQVLDDILTQALENISNLKTNTDEHNSREAFRKLKAEVESKQAIHVARTKLLYLCDGVNKIRKEEFSELVEKLPSDVQEKDRDKFFLNRGSCKTFLEKENDPYGKVLNEMKKGLDLHGEKSNFKALKDNLQIEKSVSEKFFKAIVDIIQHKIEKQFLDTLEMIAKLGQELKKHDENVSQREYLSSKTNERLKAALEMAILKALNTLGAITTTRSYRKLEMLLHASAGHLLGYSTTYIQLRNYLAHGNVIVDMLNKSMQDFLEVFANVLVQNGQTIIAMHKIMVNEENCLFLQEVLRNENLSHLVEEKSEIFGMDFCTIMKSNYWKNPYWRMLLFNVLSLEDNFSDATTVDVMAVENFTFTEFVQVTTQELCTAVSYGDLCGTQFFLEHSKRIPVGIHDHLNLLHLAAGSNNLDVIQTLLKEGFNVNATDQLSYTPLHSAVLHRNSSAVRCFMANMANAGAKDVNGYTPLHIAAFLGVVDIVALLNQHGANVREISKLKVTPLLLAAWNGHVEVTEALLSAGALMDMPEEYVGMIACVAADNGHAPILQTLIDHGVKPDCCVKNGSTPLHLATRSGHLNVVKLLVNIGANVNAKDNESFTPLHAVQVASIAKILIDAGADVDSLSHYQNAPLHFASHNGASEVVEMLLRKKANVEARDFRGLLATHVAAAEGNIDIMRQLVKEGASVNSHAYIYTKAQRKVQKQTPLGLACCNGRFDMVKLLLELKVNVDDISNYDVRLLESLEEDDEILGWPLQIAIVNRHFDIADLLLEHGASIEIMAAGNNMTALHYALYYDSPLNVVKKLMERGADVNAVAHIKTEYVTPIFLALFSRSCQSGDIMQLLIDHGADLHYKDIGYTLLHTAVSSLNFKAVELLLKNGFSIDTEGRMKRTALHRFCEMHSEDNNLSENESSHNMLRWLLDHKAAVNAVDLYNDTPLHLAAKVGSTYVVKTLLSYGANPHQLNNSNTTPYEVARRHNHIDCCALMQSFENKISNANVDTEQSIGQKVKFENDIVYKKNPLLKTEEIWIAYLYKVIVTSDDLDLKIVKPLLADKPMPGINFSNYHLLHFCVVSKKLNIMKELLQYGLDINHFNNEGQTPLHLATKTNNIDAVKCLLASGADVNRLTNNEKQSALHIGVQNENIEILQILLDTGNVITDVRNFDNETPLISACQICRLDNICEDQDAQIALVPTDKQIAIIEMLLAHGANVHASGKMGNRPLHYCICMGTMQISQKLIDHGANVNCINSDHYTPLHIATQKGNEMAVEFLLKNSANVDAKNGQNQTALHLAASKGSYEMVDYLLKNAADTELVDFDKCTPLFLAVREGHYGIVQLLVDNGACVNARCVDQWVIIHIAVQTGDIAIVEEVLQHGGQVNSVGKDGLTPLHLAIKSNLPNIVEVLLAHNAEVNVQDSTRTYPIHLACESGNVEIVEMLIQADAEVNVCNDKRISPLMFAIRYRHENCIQVLLKNNALIDFVSSQGEHCNALSVAIVNTDLAAVKLLIENGAELYSKGANGLGFMQEAAMSGSVEILEIFYHHGLSADGCSGVDDPTPLQFAVLAGYAQCVRYLLEIGANMEATTKPEFRTALFFATEMGNINIVSMLIENGANVNKMDIHENQPLHVAAIRGYPDIIEMLLSNGGDVNHGNKYGIIALHYAVYYGNLHAVKALMQPNGKKMASQPKLEKQENDAEYPSENEVHRIKEASVPKSAMIDAVTVHFGKPLSPLLIAIMKRFPEIAIELIGLGANVNFVDDDGNTALMLSISMNLLSVTHCLIKHGADVNATNNQLHTALHSAVNFHKLNVIQYLLENGADVNVQNDDGTLLHYSSGLGNRDIIQNFLNLGLDVNAVSEKGSTPLHCAALGGFVKAVDVLLEQGANVNAGNSFDHTPLHLTVIGMAKNTFCGNVLAVDKKDEFQSTAKSLILKGVDVNAMNKNGQSALHFAADLGLTSLAELLLKNGALVDGNILVYANTPLHFAAVKGHTEIIRLLLENGASVDLQDDSRETALYNATYKGHLEAVKILLCHGANTIVTDTPRSLLNFAVFNGSMSIIKLILENLPIETRLAEYLSTSDEYGFSALSIATMRGNLNATELLLWMGADANGSVNSEVPLIYAAHGGHVDILRLLLNYDCKLDQKDKKGDTALHVASEEGHLKAVEILLQAMRNNLNARRYIKKTPQSETKLAIWNTDHNDKDIQLLTEAQINQGPKSVCSSERVTSSSAMLLINTFNARHLTPLLTSIIEEHKDIAITLIEAGADVNLTDNTGDSPLMRAISNHLPDVAFSLMQHGADINAVNRESHTALHFAIDANDSEVSQYLKDIGADINVRIKDGDTLLHYASFVDKPEMIILLLSFRLNINAVNDNGKTSLHLACYHGHANTVDVLLENGADVNARDESMRTPFIDAVHGMAEHTPGGHRIRNSRKEDEFLLIAISLISKHVDVNATDLKKATALHYAVLFGQVNLIQILLDCNAEIDVVTMKLFLQSLASESHGAVDISSSLMYACERGHFETAKLLLMIGANVNATYENNWSALHFAAKSGLGSLVAALLEFGSDVNLKAKDGSTALYLSTRLGHLEVVEILLLNNASLTERNDHDSILHAATSCKNQKILELILDKLKNESNFCDYLNARDLEGDTPLMWAAESGYLEAAIKLLQCGALKTITNNDGMTALDWAMQNKHDDIVSLFTNYKA